MPMIDVNGTSLYYEDSGPGSTGETIVFSWIEWPSKQARDDAWPKLMADPRMRPDKANMPFDAQRMIYGGFATMLDA